MDGPAHKTVLKNGIRILTKKMPHTRSVSMGVWVNVGARDENLSESGLSHFIEHMIFKGTRQRSAYQIAKEFDAIGGHTNAFTTMENTCYHAKVMETHTETMVDILSDIFLNSIFDPLEIEKERPVILQEIGMVEDSPDEYVHLLSGKNFWGDNPLGRSILGTPENIIQFDADLIKKFFHRLYQPDRIVISVAGNVEHTSIADRVGPAFESIRPGNGIAERLAPPGQSLVDLNYRKLEQVHICLGAPGLPITDPRRYAYSLLNTIMGGNMSSRLFQEIREKRGLAYAVYSFIASHVDTGMFGIYFAVDPKRALETAELVLNELHKLRKEYVTAAELQGAVEYTKGSLLLASESNDNQMVRSAQNEIHFNRNIELQEVIEKVESVTTKEILNLAQSLFEKKKMVLTMLGPVQDKKPFEDILYS
ncbi:MAG: insulinase family protein [Deltaproteobacteria bacterium]|jgi:predicted Zn-dependent peptidase|nr:insulinase family protein [Deltaproteobacteria bacterium]